MERTVYVRGVGMTPFGRHEKLGLRDLGAQAIHEALRDAELETNDIDAIFSGCAVAGLTTGQECIRGQVAIQDTGLLGKPIINVEDACATSAVALHLGWMAIVSGQYDNVLVVGLEKMYSEDKTRALKAIATAADVQASFGSDSVPENAGSYFMEIYAQLTRERMRHGEYLPEHFAWVSSKNHQHAVLNDRAQYRKSVTVEQVLASRMIADPLTAMMCSPIADGAAAVILSKEPGLKSVQILASTMASGDCRSPKSAATRAVERAYGMAGLGPEDLDLAEVHDATASAEVFAYEDLQFCKRYEGWRLVEERATTLGGRVPVNTSGGLESKGHPLGATGAAQIVEITQQLRGQCGGRQVQGCKVALAHCAGGWIQDDIAAVGIHILGL